MISWEGEGEGKRMDGRNGERGREREMEEGRKQEENTRAVGTRTGLVGIV